MNVLLYNVPPASGQLGKSSLGKSHQFRCCLSSPFVTSPILCSRLFLLTKIFVTAPDAYSDFFLRSEIEV